MANCFYSPKGPIKQLGAPDSVDHKKNRRSDLIACAATAVLIWQTQKRERRLLGTL